LPRLLLLFTAVNLIVGTAAFGVSGILVPVARTLEVSVAAAGQAITAYAVATALLPPLMLARWASWPRRRFMVVTLLMLAAGCALCTVATTIEVLMLGRVLMGAGAAFSPAAAGMAVTMAAPERRGQALALIFLGISLSYALGVPLITWVGEAFGWRHAFGLCTLALLAAAAAVAASMPRGSGGAAETSYAGIGRLLQRPEVISALLFTLLYFAAIFVPFTYVAPMLRELVPLTSAQLALTLTIFGFAGVAGTLLGGAASDRFGPRRTLVALLVLYATFMAALPLSQGSPVGMTVLLSLWGSASFGMMAPQQSRLAALAPDEAPLLLSINTSMIYVGTALGAAIGGAASVGLGFARLPWVGLMPLALAALVLALTPRAVAPARTTRR
jgi:DHA1 family inner membrane transport protein